jgi:hypothetical protein
MQHNTLMLITDLSGYTRFLSRVGHQEALRHASDLLQIIINNNTLGLKLCEVEGDAVFFYAIRRLPSCEALLSQIGSTYDAFKQHLTTHGLDNELGIKFFVHTGMCEEIRIGGRTKLFGMDVIKIHRLLKNVSTSPDYLLLTGSACETLGRDMSSGETTCSAEFPHIGTVDYTILDRSFLMNLSTEHHLRRPMVDLAGEHLSIVSTALAGLFRSYRILFTPLQGIA